MTETIYSYMARINNLRLEEGGRGHQNHAYRDGVGLGPGLVGVL